MKMSLKFHSDRHKAICGNEKSLKRQGEMLARWLSTELQKKGVPVSDVSPGEYGFLSITLDGPFPVCVGCQHSEQVDGDWQCTIDGAPDFFKNLFNPVDPSPVMCNLQGLLADVLGEEVEIDDVEWGDEVPKICKY